MNVITFIVLIILTIFAIGAYQIIKANLKSIKEKNKQDEYSFVKNFEYKGYTITIYAKCDKREYSRADGEPRFETGYKINGNAKHYNTGISPTYLEGNLKDLMVYAKSQIDNIISAPDKIRSAIENLTL